jgi:hypothetical protein
MPPASLDSGEEVNDMIASVITRRTWATVVSTATASAQELSLNPWTGLGMLDRVRPW